MVDVENPKKVCQSRVTALRKCILWAVRVLLDVPF